MFITKIKSENDSPPHRVANSKFLGVIVHENFLGNIVIMFVTKYRDMFTFFKLDTVLVVNL